jgi:hypothetical protein
LHQAAGLDVRRRRATQHTTGIAGVEAGETKLELVVLG